MLVCELLKSKLVRYSYKKDSKQILWYRVSPIKNCVIDFNENKLKTHFKTRSLLKVTGNTSLSSTWSNLTLTLLTSINAYNQVSNLKAIWDEEAVLVIEEIQKARIPVALVEINGKEIIPCHDP